MISTKKHVQQLAFLLHAKGITDVIISPGSRNGPLIHTLALSGLFNCRSIVDERSAAYFATGLAQALEKPVAVVCSSGTATLNFAPAVAEAFYLSVPIIILTADRPGYWVNQGENQTIPQQDIYRNYCKKEISLPLGESEKELWYAARIINETINHATSGLPGPVHINIPLEEPLHDLVDEPLPPVKTIEVTEAGNFLNEKIAGELTERFNLAEKVLVLPGQMSPNPELEAILAELSDKTGTLILREHLSNLHHPLFTGNVDLLMTSLLSQNMEDFRPDLLITLGGSFVSKPLKQFLRKYKPSEHWHLSLADQYYDTYQSLTRIVKTDGTTFFRMIAEKATAKGKGYFNRWKDTESRVIKVYNDYAHSAGFCDLHVFQRICRSIPPESVIHLGNSSPVRYGLLPEAASGVHYLGNRGTSGIDGSLSTAVGFASVSQKTNTIILGDLSFFYDSNALWNKYIGCNLRIIVIHNGGGNIFSMIKGPGESPAFHDFFFTRNTFSAEGIAHTFGIEYLKAENQEELEVALTELYAPGREKPALLEIFTDAELNSATFRELFMKMKIDQ